LPTQGKLGPLNALRRQDDDRVRSAFA